MFGCFLLLQNKENDKENNYENNNTKVLWNYGLNHMKIVMYHLAPGLGHLQRASPLFLDKKNFCSLTPLATKPLGGGHNHKALRSSSIVRSLHQEESSGLGGLYSTHPLFNTMRVRRPHHSINQHLIWQWIRRSRLQNKISNKEHEQPC